MKRIISILLCTAFCLAFFGCTGKDDLGKQTTIDKSNGYTLVQEVLSFKYSHEEDDLKKNEKAKFDGFKVTADNASGAIKTKSDALNVAKQEVGVSYNKINIFYDRTRGVWKVIFSTDTEVTSADGTKSTENAIAQTVYVDEDGYTLATLMP